jgi:NADH dehydrogenase
MKSTLVTVFGGSGFLGRNVVRALAKQGYRIRVAVRRPRLANYLIPAGVVGQIQLVKADVCDTDDIAAALAGAQAVINLTGILYAGGGQSFADVHADAAGHIAEAAKAAGIKTLVHVSAIGADPNSDSSYAQSKAEGEKRIREAFPDAAILRPSIMFGADDSFFNRFAALARFLPFLPLIGGGHTKFQPVFVGDVAAAVVRCLDDASTRGKTYELGGPNVYSFKELMQIVLNTTDRKRILLPVPFAVAYAQAFFLGLLPSPVLTMDQVTLLKTDNVAAAGAPGLEELGITTPTSVEAEVPTYLWRFRPKGQYEDAVLEGATLQR